MCQLIALPQWVSGRPLSNRRIYPAGLTCLGLCLILASTQQLSGRPGLPPNNSTTPHISSSAKPSSSAEPTSKHSTDTPPPPPAASERSNSSESSPEALPGAVCAENPQTWWCLRSISGSLVQQRHRTVARRETELPGMRQSCQA